MAAVAPRQRSQNMFRAGRSLGHASSMFNHALAERLGLSPTAWECLSLLLENGPMPAGRLAELTGLTTGAITGLVDRLEVGGFVARQRDPGDRRRVIVAPVPAGLGGLQPLIDPMLDDMHLLNNEYSADEMAAVQTCLQQAADILRKHALILRAQSRDE